MLIKPDSLPEILENHRLWLNNDGGKQFSGEKLSFDFLNLSGTNLREAILWNGVFHTTNLKDANLREALLQNAIMVYCDLVNADMHQLQMRGSLVQWSDLTDADISKASLETTKFVDCTLVGTNFTGANLTNAKFEGSDLTCADFTDANLKNAIFNGCSVRGMKLHNAKNIPITRKEVGWSAHTTLKTQFKYGFRRNTLVDGIINKIIVSTIGEYFVKEHFPSPIRDDIYYETIVAHAKKYGYYDTADPRRILKCFDTIVLREFNEDSAMKANDMHEQIVNSVIEMLKIGAIT